MYLGGLKVTDGMETYMLKIDMHGCHCCNAAENTYSQPDRNQGL